MDWLISSMPWIWLGVIIASVIIEASTFALVAVWFMPAALVSLILALFNVPVAVQFVVFAILSAAFLIFMKPIFKKFLKIKPTATNADIVIGEKGVVVEKIDNINATGAVKVDGKVWTARSSSGGSFEKGEIVTIDSIEGVKLICSK